MNNRNILLKRIYLMLTMLIGVANLQLSIFNCQLGVAYAQDPEPAPAPKIGGNVYGGGNQGNVDGSTKVTLRAGDIGVRPVGANGKDANPTQGLDNPKGKVFGGARMANVGGNTLVNVDGENVSGYVLANYVFGGNDIAGTIGTAAAVGEELPTELKVATEMKWITPGTAMCASALPVRREPFTRLMMREMSHLRPVKR